MAVLELSTLLIALAYAAYGSMHGGLEQPMQVREWDREQKENKKGKDKRIYCWFNFESRVKISQKSHSLMHFA